MNKDSCKICGKFINKLKHICKPVWNSGLTKEDSRVKKNAESTSKTRIKLFKEGKLEVWNAGLTKENDERMNPNQSNQNV